MGFRTGPLNFVSQKLQHICRRTNKCLHELFNHPAQTFADDFSVHSKGFRQVNPKLLSWTSCWSLIFFTYLLLHLLILTRHRILFPMVPSKITSLSDVFSFAILPPRHLSDFPYGAYGTLNRSQLKRKTSDSSCLAQSNLFDWECLGLPGCYYLLRLETNANATAQLLTRYAVM